MKVSGVENTCKEYVNELQVNVEKCVYQWELVGFNHIPFLSEHPVCSPSFILGTSSESVWQLMVSKELRSKVADIEFKKKASRKSEDTKGKGGVESSEKKAGDMESKSKTRKKEVEGDSESSKDMEVDSTSQAVEHETFVEERSIGFKLVKAEEGSTWDVVKYQIKFTAGDFTITTKLRIETGSPYIDTAEFLYLYETDLVGLDLDTVENVQIVAYIEYRYLDLYPLDPWRVQEGDKYTEDLCHLFKTQKFSDVVLKAGNIEIPAHKSILCARAYGFDCHLQEDPELMKQSVSLDLEDCVARAMLAFIYCGGLPVEFPLHKCKALCTAADKYDVHNMKEVVNEFFRKKLDPEVCKQCLNLQESDLDSINLSDKELEAILQKKTCSHKSQNGSK